VSTRVARPSLSLLMMVSCCVVASTPAVAGDADAKPVPVGPIPGAREVHTRDAHGRLDVFTSIPDGSKFGSEGGAGRPCGAWIPDSGPAAVPGESSYVDSMNWIFIEGQAFASSASYPIFDSKDRTLPGPVLGAGSPTSAARTFSVFCQNLEARNFRGAITVTGTDPSLDPRPRAAELRNGVRLERPVVVPDPTVASFGRLVTRHPSWLAILPSSWGMRASAVEYWRGWELQLILRPIGLEFTAVQRPPDGKSPGVDAGVRAPFTVSIPCVGGGPNPVWGTDRFPERPPSLPNFSAPGIGTEIGLGGCVWTPEFLGTVSLTARVTYEVTFWMSGYTERLADYVWDSVPVDFAVGGLSVVNVNGGA
jgi:hypothetical protein